MTAKDFKPGSFFIYRAPILKEEGQLMIVRSNDSNLIVFEDLEPEDEIENTQWTIETKEGVEISFKENESFSKISKKEAGERSRKTLRKMKDEILEIELEKSRLEDKLKKRKSFIIFQTRNLSKKEVDVL